MNCYLRFIFVFGSEVVSLVFITLQNKYQVEKQANVNINFPNQVFAIYQLLWRLPCHLKLVSFTLNNEFYISSFFLGQYTVLYSVYAFLKMFLTEWNSKNYAEFLYKPKLIFGNTQILYPKMFPKTGIFCPVL
jgi:hypothetical protein